MNIPALEAEEDLRFILAGGAVFAGKKGNEYIEHLQDIAWDSEPEKVQTGRKMLAAADAGRGLPQPPPDVKGGQSGNSPVQD